MHIIHIIHIMYIMHCITVSTDEFILGILYNRIYHRNVYCITVYTTGMYIV